MREGYTKEMNRLHFNHGPNTMMVSNLAFLIPITTAIILGNWIYFALGLGVLFFSPLFHYADLQKKKGTWYQSLRVGDWFFAIATFGYLAFFAFTHFETRYAWWVIGSLLAVAGFFFYGWKWGDYERLHPWFHLVASIGATTILFLGN